MPYEKYANQHNCSGKCLYQLCKIGVPVHVVEDLVFVCDDAIHYRGRVFATVVWDELTPIFSFARGYSKYAELQVEFYSQQESHSEPVAIARSSAEFRRSGSKDFLHGERHGSKNLAQLIPDGIEPELPVASASFASCETRLTEDYVVQLAMAAFPPEVFKHLSMTSGVGKFRKPSPELLRFVRSLAGKHLA